MLSLFWLQCYDTYNRQFQSSQIPTFPSHHSMNGRCYLWKTAKALLFLCRYQSASNQKPSWLDWASSISLFLHNKENAVHHMKNWKYLRRNRKVLQYLRPMFAPFNIHINPNLLLYSFTLQDTFHLEFFLIYDQLFIPQSWYEELKILVETSKSFALCLVYTKIHIYFYNSAQMILQLGNRIVTFYFLAATRRWMTFSILHCARRLPSSIFPHLRPIVHSPLHVP